ncbi:hypothetical protein P7C70_g7111, partial [Phenoliferia sp. Uapishka_3]
MSSAYHPMTNGKIERMHRDMNQIFRQMVDENQLNWPQQLPFVQFAINTSISSSTGLAPFEISRTHVPSSLPSWATGPSNTTYGALLENAQLRLSSARDAITRARLEQAAQSNTGRQAEEAPEKTDLFWVSTKNWNTVPARSRKWCPPWAGPFPSRSYDPLTSSYELVLPPRYLQRRISPVFHASQLKKYVPNDDEAFPNRLTNPVPIFPLDDATDNKMGFVCGKHYFTKQMGPKRYVFIQVIFDLGSGNYHLRYDAEEFKTPEGTKMLAKFLAGTGYESFDDLPDDASKSGKRLREDEKREIENAERVAEREHRQQQTRINRVRELAQATAAVAREEGQREKYKYESAEWQRDRQRFQVIEEGDYTQFDGYYINSEYQRYAPRRRIDQDQTSGLTPLMGGLQAGSHQGGTHASGSGPRGHHEHGRM